LGANGQRCEHGDGGHSQDGQDGLVTL
jgi:hypothetical protein